MMKCADKTQAEMMEKLNYGSAVALKEEKRVIYSFQKKCLQKEIFCLQLLNCQNEQLLDTKNKLEEPIFII